MTVKDPKRIVFKVGSSTLIHKTGKTNLRHMGELVRALSDLRNAGTEVALVTSGAIGVGVGKLGLAARPSDTPGRQAAASVGQCELMFMYDKMFSEYGHIVGQLLITKSDVDDAERRENLINTFEKLFEFGAIPVINENDSVAVDEIVYGDNDSLSAIVARLIGADALVILTDIDGLYDANPAKDPAAKLIPVVERVTPDIVALAGGAGSALGTGGMATKVHAARIACEAGIDTVVMNGTPIDNIYRLLGGASVGTLFKAVKS
ncbi:MAG: glutamate 5-kinase [Oscillospiraceae bacterium]|nr:glutamate 5-kinase [Oscillospiraceae bacterium]